MNMRRSGTMNLWRSGILNLRRSEVMNLQRSGITNQRGSRILDLQNCGFKSPKFGNHEWEVWKSERSQVKDATSKSLGLTCELVVGF
jgi:hypothetical protein